MCYSQDLSSHALNVKQVTADRPDLFMDDSENKSSCTDRLNDL